MSTVFRYAIATGRAVRNPAADVGVALKTTVKGHHPAITEPKRFAQMMRDIYAYSGSNITRAAVQIHALTFQRPNEIRDMEWAEIDLEAGVWIVPAARMKGILERKAYGDAHTVPLSTQAVAVQKICAHLQAMASKYFQTNVAKVGQSARTRHGRRCEAWATLTTYPTVLEQAQEH
jgi:integrase